MLRENVLFILGNIDYEMNFIKEILEKKGMSYAVAQKDGFDVNGENAYDADSYGKIKGDVDKINKDYSVIFVECDVKDIRPIRVIDHHRPGDYGYGRPPEDFWNASSIGQIWNLPEIYESDIPSNYLYVAAFDHCFEDACNGICPGIDVLNKKEKINY